MILLFLFFFTLQVADSLKAAKDRRADRTSESNDRADLNDERIRSKRNIRNAFGDTILSRRPLDMSL